MSNQIRKVARGVGITKKIGWHTFRHTCATLLRASGADIKVVQELLPLATLVNKRHDPALPVQRGVRKVLRKAVVRLKPKLHVFGHCHAGYGIFPTEKTMFVNAALLGLSGEIENSPIVMDTV